MFTGPVLDQHNFTKMTGEDSVFELHESDVGAFSGFETVYWTTAGNCSMSDGSDGVNYGTIAAANYSGVVSSMSLLHLQPALYTLCYDVDGTGSALHELQTQVTLLLQGTVCFLMQSVRRDKYRPTGKDTGTSDRSSRQPIFMQVCRFLTSPSTATAVCKAYSLSPRTAWDDSPAMRASSGPTTLLATAPSLPP